MIWGFKVKQDDSLFYGRTVQQSALLSKIHQVWMAQIVVNVSNFNGFLPLFFEKIRNFNKNQKLKLESYSVPLD